MPDPEISNTETTGPVELARSFARIAETSQRLVTGFLDHEFGDGPLGKTVRTQVGKAFVEMTQKMLANPMKLAEASMALWQSHIALWQKSTLALFGQKVEPAAVPTSGDKRFKHSDWDNSFVFDFIKQSYLLTAEWLQTTVSEVEGMDEQSKKRVEFFTRQFVDALSPTNFALTNPEVLRATIDAKGENLLKGLRTLLEDLERGKGKLALRTTDQEAFRLGENLAITPGKVVYQNELIQLLQYQPTTDEVFKRPLLIVPPWINKYYILDLREKNSFIKWCVEQGFTVFVISWVNPDAKLAEKGFEDYMLEGPLAALDAIEQATGVREVNGVSYCLGGTVLAPTLAYMAAKGDTRIKSATYLNTLLDFSHPGELEVFVDEEHIAALEEHMEREGFLHGSYMAKTFNILRANDLIWSSVINNYLLGRDPFPFDILYWNSDCTNLPAQMHSFYLRKMYQKNLLKEPNALTLAGQPIDLRQVATPSYFLSTIEDHIVPWKGAYAGAQLFSGRVRFVLSGSGHVAGVVNPPAASKYWYWTNPKISAGPEEWFEGVTRHQGSWWPDWSKWVRRYAGDKVPARVPGDGKLPVIEDAPGSYVKLQ